MDQGKNSSSIWLLLIFTFFIIFTPYARGENTPSTLAATSSVSYDSLRIMANSGQQEQAIKLAQEYLKTHENSAIRVLLARMLARDKQFDAAKEQLYFVLSKHPGDYDASECLADVEIMQGNYQRALSALTNALKFNPNNEKLLEKREIILAKQQVSKGNRPEAIKIAENYLKSHESINMQLYLASQLSINNQYDEARKQLVNVLSKDPSKTEASAELGNIEIATGSYNKALQVINDGLKYSPKDSDLLQSKTFVENKLNPSAKSVTKENTAPGVAVSIPAATAAPAKSGISYDELKKMSTTSQRPKAIKLAEESLKQSDNGDIRMLLAYMLAWEGRYDESRKQFEIILKSKPDSLDAAKGLANVELWSDHDKRALVIVENALKYHPGDKDLLQQRNRALGITALSPEQLRKLYSAGQPEKAKELAREYLRNNDNVDIHLTLGFMESWDSEYDDAKNQFNIVLRKKPGYSDASFGLAKVYIYTDDYLSALRVVNAGLAFDPDNKDLLETRKNIMQRLNEINILGPGLFSAMGVPSAVGPYSPGKKMNAIFVNQEFTYVDDLKQIWKISTLGYERYTPLGPILFSFNQFDRFNSAGNQVVVEAYPGLWKGAYMYLGYGYSSTSYIARNYVGFEPFFSLPHGFEFSAGERILQFQGGTTHLYTGSIAKYWGNYWFALRPYYTGKGSRSYYFTTRRYFSSPDSYIGITVGGGKGPNTFDLLDPDSISSNFSRTVRLVGNVPLTENLIFTWLAQYSYEHFPNTNIRQQTDVDAGFIWRY